MEVRHETTAPATTTPHADTPFVSLNNCGPERRFSSQRGGSPVQMVVLAGNSETPQADKSRLTRFLTGRWDVGATPMNYATRVTRRLRKSSVLSFLMNVAACCGRLKHTCSPPAAACAPGKRCD